MLILLLELVYWSCYINCYIDSAAGNDVWTTIYDLNESIMQHKIRNNSIQLIHWSLSSLRIDPSTCWGIDHNIYWFADPTTCWHVDPLTLVWIHPAIRWCIDPSIRWCIGPAKYVLICPSTCWCIAKIPLLADTQYWSLLILMHWLCYLHMLMYW
jgi:hypothetical protein